MNKKENQPNILRDPTNPEDLEVILALSGINADSPPERRTQVTTEAMRGHQAVNTSWYARHPEAAPAS